MNLFKDKNIKPMLIKNKMPAFNDENWIYELKLDGCRCLAYLNQFETDLRNKGNIALLSRFPELGSIHESICETCIMDGELIVLKNGVPDFYELQRRTILSDPFKIKLAASKYPATFVAYDCLYYGSKDLMMLKLMDRKQYLERSLKNENDKIARSRYIEKNGIGLYYLAEERQLEGVVAKRKDSQYFQNKKTKDWIKFKRYEDEDFIIMGYLRKNRLFKLILGKYKNGNFIYKGHVVVAEKIIQLLSVSDTAPMMILPSGNDQAIWVDPIVCTVEYMPNTKNSLREARFKGIREEIPPKECKVQ